MPTTPILGITQLTPSQNQKEVTINDAIIALEAATNATLSVALVGTSYTLTANQATRSMIFKVTGAASPSTLNFPIAVNGVPLDRLFVVRNESGHPLTVKFATGTGSTVVVPNEASRLLSGIEGTDMIVAAEPATVVSFVDLGDSPGTYAGMAGKVLAANLAENALEFVDVVTFPAYTGNAGKVLAVTAGADGVEWVTIVTNFLSLSDTPNSYTGQANRLVRVNGAANALEFVDLASPEAVEYKSSTRWRIYTLVVDDGQAGWAEIEMLDVDGINLIGTGTATASSVYLARDALYAFDGITTPGSGWLSDVGDPEDSWIEYEFDAPVSVRSLVMWPISEVLTMTPTQFRVERWDGSAWVNLGTRSSAPWVEETSQAFPVNGESLSSVTEAPEDGQGYARRDGAWEAIDIPAAIDDLTDVDTATTPPTDGQGLVWDDAAGAWKPGVPAGGPAEYPVGGTTGQALVKNSGLDNDVEWGDVVEEAPSDGTLYARKDGAWETFDPGTGTGDLVSTNNLSDVADPVASRVNLKIVVLANQAAYDALDPVDPDTIYVVQEA